MKIKVFYSNEPVLDVKTETNGKPYGLHRDRNPDAGWGPLRWTLMDERVKDVDLTDELRKILVEDICTSFPDYKIYNKLKEFDLLK